MNKTVPKQRKFFGMRVDPNLLVRVELVAKKQRSNPRIVIEQCVAAYLPQLELDEDMEQLNVEIPNTLKRTIKAAAAADGIPLQEWTAAALLDKLEGRTVVNSDPFSTGTPDIAETALKVDNRSGRKRRASRPPKKTVSPSAIFHGSASLANPTFQSRRKIKPST